MNLSITYDLPLSIREVKATEARLNAIYAAAKLGVKGNSLALAAGMLPAEYQRLRASDTMVDLAEAQGRAHDEMQQSKILHEAAEAGDPRAALDILRHQHNWVAKTQVSLEVDQRISVLGALEQANQRVIEGTFHVEP